MPWMSEYNISDLKDFRIIRTILEDCGDLAREYGQRLSFHPGPFDVLASLNEKVVTKSIADLILGQRGSNVAQIGVSPINIHLWNGAMETVKD